VSEEAAALAALAAAVNPAAVALAAGGRVPPRLAAIAAATAAVVLGTAVALARPLLDGLALSPESFRVAAGIVMIAGGIQVFLFSRRAPRSPQSWQEAVHPLGLPAIATPAAAAAAISVSANEGVSLALGGVALAIALGGAGVLAGPRPALGTAARFIAALLIVLGIAEIVDGVKAI
jgi:small neutral amino acid transporter SnatA (MarC family)